MKTRRARRQTTAVLLITSGIAAALGPQICAANETAVRILDQAPADSQILFLVPSLARFSEKLALIDEQLSLNLPEFKSVLSLFKRTTGLAAGVKDEAAAMVAISINQPQPEAGPVLQSLVLLPVSDYASFAGQLEGDPESAVTQITLATRHKAYLKHHGEFAVIGRERALVESYRPAGTSAQLKQHLGQVGQHCLTVSDLVLIVHGSDLGRLLQTVTNTLLPLLATPVEATAERSLPVSLMGAAVLSGGFGTSTDLLADGSFLLGDAGAVVVGVDVTHAGIGLTATVQFKTGSKLAKAFGDGGGTAATLARLHRMPYITATTVSFRGVDFANLDSLTGQQVAVLNPSNWVEMTLIQAGEKGQPLKSYVQVLYTSSQPAVAGPPMVRYVATDDSNAFLDALRENIERMNEAAGAAQPTDANGEGDLPARPSYSARYHLNQMELGEHRVDQFVISPQSQVPGQVPQSVNVGLSALFGNVSSETSGYVVGVDHGVVVTETTDTAFLRAILEALKQDNGLGNDPSLAAVRANLFDDPSMEAYFDLRSALDLVRLSPLQFLIQQQLPNPPADMAPIAMAMNMAQHGIAARLFVPSSVTAYTGTLVEHFRSRMDQGPQPQDRRPERSRERHRRAAPPATLPGGFTVPPL